jgi:hypothetical protein
VRRLRRAPNAQPLTYPTGRDRAPTGPRSRL